MVYEKYATIAIVIVAVISVFLAKEVGTSGGEIRHTEIRENASQTIDAPQNENEHEKAGDDN